MQLNPRESFTIVRQLEDHLDSATYYVRAVVRNAKSDAIIQFGGLDYVNLTDRTNRRFSKVIQVPADVSGQGFYISILTTVYSDSAYTTKSPNYGEKMDTYLVQERSNLNLGGGGGSDIDYKKIRMIIREEVKSEMDERPEPEPKTIRIETTVVKEVKVPQVIVKEVVNHGEILKAIAAVGKKVDDKPVTEVPEVEKVDLTPVISRIDSLSDEIKDCYEKSDDNLRETMEEVSVSVNLSGLSGRIAPSPRQERKKVSESEKLDDRLKKLNTKI